MTPTTDPPCASRAARASSRQRTTSAIAPRSPSARMSAGVRCDRTTSCVRSSAATSTKSALTSTPTPTTPPGAEPDGLPGPPDAADPLDLALADQAALDELGDEAGHGGLVEAGVGGDARARAGPGVPQVAEDEAEVGPSDGQLVGRSRGHPGRHRRHPLGSWSEHPPETVVPGRTPVDEPRGAAPGRPSVGRAGRHAARRRRGRRARTTGGRDGRHGGGRRRAAAARRCRRRPRSRRAVAVDTAELEDGSGRLARAADDLAAADDGLDRLPVGGRGDRGRRGARRAGRPRPAVAGAPGAGGRGRPAPAAGPRAGRGRGTREAEQGGRRGPPELSTPGSAGRPRPSARRARPGPP